MQIELCFHDEINQLCEPPNTFVDLLKSATSSFGTDLPEKWALGLIDSQCGIIYLNDETDYQELLRRKLANKSKRILINIIPEVKQAKSSEKNSQSYSDSLSFTKENETPNEKGERNLRPEKIKQEQIPNLRKIEENRDEIDKTVTDILSHLSKEGELPNQVSEREIKKRRRQEEIIEKYFEETSSFHVIIQRNDGQSVPILSDEEFLDENEVNKNTKLRKKEDQKVIHQQQIEKKETENEEELKNSENSAPFYHQDNQKQRQEKLNNPEKDLKEGDDRQKETLTPGSPLKKQKGDIEGDSKEAREYKEQRKLKEIQNLFDLRDEFSSMPTCAEKSLLTLIYFASLLLIEPEYRTKGGFSIPENMSDKIDKEVETLLCRIEKEILPIKTDNLKKYILRAKNNDIKGMKEGLQATLKEIRPLNCQEVLRLVREGEKTADLVAGQDVVALFGKTGSGKSTAIHFLAGTKMNKITVDGENHIAPIQISPQLEKVTTSPSDKSETKYITSVTINPADLGLWSNKTIIFLDTAGFGDNRGVEVDIANGLSIIKAIEKCKSVKMVILVSYKGNGDRFEGLKSLAHTLVGMIPSIQDHLHAFAFLFTKYPDDEKDKIHATLENINKRMTAEEKSDEGFYCLLGGMHQKTRKGAIIVDPVKGDPKTILQELMDIGSISHPDEVFQFSIAENSKAILQEQIHRDQLSIINGLKIHDYEIVKYKLDNIKLLCDLLSFDILKQTYSDCITFVKKNLIEHYQNSINAINRCLIEGNMTQEDVEQYRRNIIQSESADLLRESHLKNEVMPSSALVQNLLSQAGTLLINQQDKKLNDKVFKSLFDKIRILSNTFPEIKSKYEELGKILKEKLKITTQSFEEALHKDDFEGCGQELTKLSEATLLFEEHSLWFEEIKSLYSQLQKLFVKDLRRSIHELDSIFTKERLENQEVRALENCLSRIELVKTTLILHKHVQMEDIKSLYDGLFTRIIDNFERINNKIVALFEEKKESSFAEIEPLMKEMELYRTIHSIDSNTCNSYHTTVNTICNFIQGFKSDIIQELRLISQHIEKVNYNKLLRALIDLQNAKWIENFRKNVYSSLMKEVEQNVNENYETLFTSLKNIKLNFEQVEKIQIAYDILLRIADMQPLVRIFPVLNEEITSAQALFEEKANNVFEIIQGYLDQWNQDHKQILSFNFRNTEKALNYLTKSSTIPLLHKNSMILLNKIESLIANKRCLLSNRIEDIFRSIINYTPETRQRNPSESQNGLEIPFEESKEEGENLLSMSSLSDSQNNNMQSKENTLKSARELGEYLLKVLEMNNKFPTIYAIFDPEQMFIKDWEKKLIGKLNELEEIMQQTIGTSNIQELKKNLFITKCLSELDEFMENRTFFDLYKHYNQKFFADAPIKLSETIDAMKRYDFSFVLDQLLQFSRSEDLICRDSLKKLRKILSDFIETLQEETKSMVRYLLNSDMEKVKVFLQNLKRIQEAKELVLQYTSPQTKRNLECFTDDLKKRIELTMNKEIENIKENISNLNFDEVDKQKENLTEVYFELGPYCNEKIGDEIKKLDTLQKECLAKLSEDYTKLKVTDYSRNPPKNIFAKLKSLNNKNSLYKGAWDQIENKIQESFREELVKTRRRALSEESNYSIKRLQTALKFLPEDLKVVLEDELAICQEEIENDKKERRQDLDSLLMTDDLQKIAEFLQKTIRMRRSHSFVRVIEENISNRIYQISSQIHVSIEKGHINEVFPLSSRLGHFKSLFGEHFELTNKVHSEAKSRLERWLKQCCKFIKTEITKPELSETSNGAIKEIERAFQNLIETTNLKNDPKNRNLIDDFISTDIITYFNQITKTFYSAYFHNEEKLKIAIQNFDVSTIEKGLKTKKKWERAFSKIMQQHIETDNTNEEQLENNPFRPIASYSSTKQIVVEKITSLKESFLKKELIREETKGFGHSRNLFYEELRKEFLILKSIGEIKLSKEHLHLGQECLESLEQKSAKIYSTVEDILTLILKEEETIKKVYEEFTLNYENLMAMERHMESLKIIDKKKLENVELKILEKVGQIANSLKSDNSVENITACLLKMKHLAINLPSFKSEIDKIIDQYLFSVKNKNEGTRIIAKLGTILNQNSSDLGQLILSEHKCFQGYTLALFNSKIQSHGIDYVLKNLKYEGYQLNQKTVNNRYSEFETKYQELIKKYLKVDMKLDQLISDTLVLVGTKLQKEGKICWDNKITDKIPELIAHLFALWTLQNSQHFFEAHSLENRDSYLKKPHAAQVISIFCTLGITQDKKILQNNLVQIKTGEGKSVTLAISAAVLALFGFDVSCACYSSYLSERDNEEFKTLFDCLNISNRIHYGTFNKLCEDMINQHGDVRKMVETLVSNNNYNSFSLHQKKTAIPKILLIDEVDVFFSKDFYGQIYNPVTTLKDPTISNLIDLIWKEKDNQITSRIIQATNEYRACCDKFKEWEPLILETIKNLLFDVKEYPSHSYLVKDDKIGYKEQDKIAFNILHGYQTMFAYYKEYEKGNISKESLEENKAFKIKCGDYSYAEIPQQFKYIMGVTGTLEDLNESEKQVIKQSYGILKSTFIPSMFGKNNLRFIKKDDVMIENENDYYNAINREIDVRLNEKSNGVKRAVLVFFESEKQLMDFRNSASFSERKESALYLTEEATKQEKESIIRQATQSGKVTLLTKIFGRGTDFICYDQEVPNNGGIHVLQTFLSDEHSEEIQIKGRTARQGDFGSYSMVLLDSSLEKFSITPEDLEKVDNGTGVVSRFVNWCKREKTFHTKYDLINDFRNETFNEQYKENQTFVFTAKKLHEAANKFLTNMIIGNINEAKNYLLTQNKGTAVEEITSRTILLMDGTGSMKNLLDKAKHTVETTFKQAYEVLKDHNINPECFQVQFVIYRNYSSPEDKILQCSPWETRPDNLRKFMELIKVEGGQGREAIEVGLWHVNRKNEKEEVSQVILIGDAPANTEEEVKKKRKGKDWKNSQFKTPTYYVNEMQKLRDRKIPVHAFYVDERAEQNFEEIANTTGGRCEMLDINSPAGADMLTGLVTECILRNIGQMNGKGDDLVEAYRKKFSKSYQ